MAVMEIDWNLVLTGFGNLGTVLWVAKRTVTTVEEHRQIIPHLATIAEEMKNHLPILYERDNELGERLTRVEQTHLVLGCNAPDAQKRQPVRKRRRPNENK